MIDLNQEKYLQRLVESELSVEEENDAIIQCERDGRLWRSVALALLERRRVADVLFGLQEEMPPVYAVHSGNTDLVVTNRDSAHESTQGNAKAMLAVAASVLISIAAGGGLGWHFGNQRADVMADSRPAQALGATHPVLVHVVYPDSQSEATSQASPGFDFGQPILNARARSVLRNAGIEVEEVASWNLVGDGQRQQAVPSREVRLTSTR